MNQHGHFFGHKSIWSRSLTVSLMFTLLLTFCFTGAAPASAAASSDLIIVNKKTNTLGYFSGGKLVRTFPVATGKTKSLTPEGSFKIVVKIKNRPYYKENIPGGDPANPLGDRWLGLEVNGTKGTTYAIHGNNNESSIGKYVSAGCIRMHNEDIHWLYPQIAKNTTVVVTSSALSLESIAAKSGYSLSSTMFAGTFIINGKPIKLKDDFILENSRVFVPLRETVALLGGTLKLDAGSGNLIITIGNRIVTHKPLSSQAVAQGKTVSIIASKNVNNRLYLPLGSLTELFGLPFQWNAKDKAVIL
ncbi:L,D-transpeptidase family protein [Paenibacillus sp. S150]|uniref:L,D-transpeptidase family protein n=1 Tax=Paenibacillus sp. S150 TaxID=2749826 RepID=UPI001C55FE8B|nr:L,D-transpeptidase family protein [Paenibacillus sp. S150]MBW4081513.1 L,D-transpeptidase family protein [Paenibacillus sp. S150]